MNKHAPNWLFHIGFQGWFSVQAAAMSCRAMASTSEENWWKKSCTTWDLKNLANTGVNYQAQLVQDLSLLSTACQLLVNWWFGYSGSSLWKGLLLRGTVPLESQTTRPQTTNLSLVEYGYITFNLGITLPKLTARPWKMMLGRLLSFWDGIFSGGEVSNFSWVGV